MKKFDYSTYHAAYNKSRYDRVEFFAPKGRKAAYKEAAEKSGQSLSAWLINLAEKEVKSRGMG